MKKVLVVDDSRIVCKLVEIHIGRSYEVDTCENPFHVLDKVAAFKPDVILLDIRMPGLSGKSVAGLLKEAHGKAAYRTIIFSSEHEDIQKKLVAEGLADAYVVKSPSLDGLRDAIGRVLASPDLIAA